MCLSEHDTTAGGSVMGGVMKRHGHDAMTLRMTAHDTNSVMAEGAGNQREAKGHDTMTLDSSKWRDKGKNRVVKTRGRELERETGGREDSTESSVMPSWRGER